MKTSECYEFSLNQVIYGYDYEPQDTTDICEWLKVKEKTWITDYKWITDKGKTMSANWGEILKGGKAHEDLLSGASITNWDYLRLN